MPESKKGTILVIDDESMHINLVQLVLQKGNYVVLRAENAANGIEIARKQHPDIILMDIRLPVIDGLEATRRIKSDPELKNIPVVALSASVMMRDIEKSLEAGCVGHLSKPIEVKNFVDVMEKIVSQGHAA